VPRETRFKKEYKPKVRVRKNFASSAGECPGRLITCPNVRTLLSTVRQTANYRSPLSSAGSQRTSSYRPTET
jgi:hypothetical protein